MTNSPPTPAPTLPELAGLAIVMLAKIATDVGEIAANQRKPARKAGPGGETLEEISRRVLERKFNPFLSCGGDAYTTRDALCREFGFGMRQCNKLVEYWTVEGYGEAKPGTGVRLFAQRRS